MSNTPGHNKLSELQQLQIKDIKERGQELLLYIETLKAIDDGDFRSLSIARTEIQTGIMWAIRAVAKPTTEC